MKTVKLQYVPGDRINVNGKVGIVECVELYEENFIQYKINVDGKIHFYTQKDMQVLNY
jgi:hypothetical protein